MTKIITYNPHATLYVLPFLFSMVIEWLYILTISKWAIKPLVAPMHLQHLVPHTLHRTHTFTVFAHMCIQIGECGQWLLIANQAVQMSKTWNRPLVQGNISFNCFFYTYIIAIINSHGNYMYVLWNRTNFSGLLLQALYKGHIAMVHIGDIYSRGIYI